MRVGFLGPAGTYSQEAVFAGPGSENYEPVPLPTVHDAVMAVHEGRVERALVPIENSLEGAVNATLDALAFETDDVLIAGELVHPIHHCLIAREPVALERIAAVASHPQASGQCATLPAHAPAARRRRARRLDRRRGAVVAEREDGEPWAALGSRAAAELYGCAVLAAGVEDPPGTETRFVWIAREAPDPRAGGALEDRADVLGAERRPAGLARALPAGVRRPRASTSPASSRARAGAGSAPTCSSSTSTAARTIRAGGRRRSLRCAPTPRACACSARFRRRHSYTPRSHGDSCTTRPTGVCAARRPPAART